MTYGTATQNSSTGLWTYSYELSDEGGGLQSLVMPEPVDPFTIFVTPPTVTQIPVGCNPVCVIDYHQDQDTVGFLGPTYGCAAGYSAGFCGEAPPGDIEWLFSHGGGATCCSTVFGIISPDPPGIESGVVTYGFGLGATQTTIALVAPTPEPSTLVLLISGVLLLARKKMIVFKESKGMKGWLTGVVLVLAFWLTSGMAWADSTTDTILPNGIEITSDVSGPSAPIYIDGLPTYHYLYQALNVPLYDSIIWSFSTREPIRSFAIRRITVRPRPEPCTTLTVFRLSPSCQTHSGGEAETGRQTSLRLRAP